MNRFLFLLAKHDVYIKVSENVSFSFTSSNGQVNLNVFNNLTKDFHLAHLSTEELKSILSTPQVHKTIDTLFSDYLDLYYETRTTLDEMLDLLEHKQNIPLTRKKTLSELLRLTASRGNFEITDGVNLKLLTSCNTRPLAGYDLHFQICIDPSACPPAVLKTLQGANLTKKMPRMNAPQTLAALHQCTQAFPTTIQRSIERGRLHEFNRTADESLKYMDLKNHYFTPKSPTCEKE